MSLRKPVRKLILATAALALLTVLDAATSSPSYGGDCIDVIAYAIDPVTHICYQFANPCAVPPGWTFTTGPCGEIS